MHDYFDGEEEFDNSTYERVMNDVKNTPITEAVEGWCDIDCDAERTLFIAIGLIFGILAATGRIGNILVALRLVKLYSY